MKHKHANAPNSKIAFAKDGKNVASVCLYFNIPIISSISFKAKFSVDVTLINFKFEKKSVILLVK